VRDDVHKYIELFLLITNKYKTKTEITIIIIKRTNLYGRPLVTFGCASIKVGGKIKKEKRKKRKKRKKERESVFDL